MAVLTEQWIRASRVKNAPPTGQKEDDGPQGIKKGTAQGNTTGSADQK